MTTVIFVHGIGGRKYNLIESFEEIQYSLSNHKLLKGKKDLKIELSDWGERKGAELKADGASIYNYDLTGGEADSKQKLWQQLYRDPLYELRFLIFKPSEGLQHNYGNDDNPEDEFKERVNNLVSSDKVKNIVPGIWDIFLEAHKKIACSTHYEFLAKKVSSSLADEYYDSIARAIVAQMIWLSQEKGRSASIVYNHKLRDRVKKCIFDELTEGLEAKATIADLVFQWGLSQLQWKGQSCLDRKLGALHDFSYPLAGDILVYQAKGQRIRNYIKKQVDKAGESVILLAHSLGGIACVELLAKVDLKNVKLLVTVGSQTPYLYELDALQCLDYGETLRADFPRWINIHDPQDILSYTGNHKKLFQGRVEDIPVNNQQPFPQCHKAYWSNSKMWDFIAKAITEI